MVIFNANYAHGNIVKRLSDFDIQFSIQYFHYHIYARFSVYL